MPPLTRTPRPILSRLITLSPPGTRVFGRTLNAPPPVVIRLTIDGDGPAICRRVDGKPLGSLVEDCRDQIDAACRELRQELARQAEPDQPATTADAADYAASEAPPLDPAGKTTSAIFRCDQQTITDRITRVRTDRIPASPPPAAPSTATDERNAALARMAELREQHWREHGKHPSEALLAPVDEPSPAKTASSIFRVDREVITDRITRLRRKSPPPAPPSP